MGRPLLAGSFDGSFFYPCLVTPVAAVVKIHPNLITLACILCKLVVLRAMVQLQPLPLLVWGVLERYLDCLDGEVARVHDMKSRLGHYLDKISDMVFKVCQTLIMLRLVLWHGAACPDGAAAALAMMAFVLVPWGLDVRDGLIRSDMHTPADGRFIYIEDNGTVFVFILPTIIGSFAAAIAGASSCA